MAPIGVLSVQGGYQAHQKRLAELGHESVEIRTAEQLPGVDGLILPGGESTTQLKLIDREPAGGGTTLREALARFFETDKPILATCAGLILAAKRVHDPDQRSLGWLDVAVQRNAYGRQLDSFEATSDGGQPLVFIRAPRIVGMGEGVDVLDTLDGEPILVRQASVVGACFHPELTNSVEVHRQVFGHRALKLVVGGQKGGAAKACNR